MPALVRRLQIMILPVKAGADLGAASGPATTAGYGNERVSQTTSPLSSVET